MYIIITTIFIILIVLFWDTLIILLKTLNSKNLNNGYVWFGCLLAINVIIISFIIGFYYHKKNSVGKSGSDGIKGFSGVDGEQCNFALPCINKE